MPIRRTASIGGHSPGSGHETPAEEGSSPAGSRRVSRQSSRSNLGAADGPDEARGNKVVPEVEETAQSRSISKIIKVRARRSPARSLGAIKIVVRSTPRAATSAVLVDRPRERAVRLSDPASLPADARVPGGPRGALPRRDEETFADAAIVIPVEC